MLFIIVPIEELKQFDPDWEYRRKSNDGTKAIIHQEIYDELVPPEMTLEEPEVTADGETVPAVRHYQYPIVSGDELDKDPDFMYVPTEEEKAAMEAQAAKSK